MHAISSYVTLCVLEYMLYDSALELGTPDDRSVAVGYNRLTSTTYGLIATPHMNAMC